MAKSASWLSVESSTQPVRDALAAKLKSWRADDLFDDSEKLAEDLIKKFKEQYKRAPIEREEHLLRIDAFCQCATTLNVQLHADFQILRQSFFRGDADGERHHASLTKSKTCACLR